MDSARSPLLPQPGGFEGLLAGRVLAAPCDLPVANREDLHFGLVSFDAADPGASAVPLNRDHRVSTGVDQFDRLHPEPVEHVDPVLEVRAQRVRALYRAPIIDGTLDCPVVDIVGEML